MTTKTDSHSSPAPRLQNPQASPAAWAGMMALQQAVNGLGLEPSLYELVKLRASQLNGCAYCIDMHFADGLARGERAERLYLLDAWEEAGVYSARERAALRWTEALTRLTGRPIPDEVYTAVRAEFSEAELLNLTLGIVAINGWNRFNVGFRVPPRATDHFTVSKKPSRPAERLAGAPAPATVTA